MSQVHIKVNNTIGQILLAKRLGKTVLLPKRVQHGVATATVCALMGLECIVYMGEVDIKRQAPTLCVMLGAEIVTSGSRTLKTLQTKLFVTG
jgi:tryptophan synthase beta chain